jgi:hypothetical protein
MPIISELVPDGEWAGGKGLETVATLSPGW